MVHLATYKFHVNACGSKEFFLKPVRKREYPRVVVLLKASALDLILASTHLQQNKA